MKIPQKYLTMCGHPEIQALRPEKCSQPKSREPGTGSPNLSCDTVARGPVPRELSVESADLWLPTREQLHALLAEKLPYPETSVLQQTADGWEYQTCLREWAADYGTYIDAHRRFVGASPEVVLLQALAAALGIGERWMV